MQRMLQKKQIMYCPTRHRSLQLVSKPSFGCDRAKPVDLRSRPKGFSTCPSTLPFAERHLATGLAEIRI